MPTITGTLIGSVETTVNATTGVTSTGTTATGDGFLVFASTTASGFNATAVTDTFGNAFTLLGTITTDATFTTTTGVWLCQQGIGGANHAFTIHPNSSALVSAFAVRIQNGKATGLFDQISVNVVDSASPFLSGSLTTTQANELAVVFTLDNRSSAAAPTWGNSFTSLGDLSNNAAITASCALRNLTSIQAVQSSFTDAAITRAISWLVTLNEVIPPPATIRPYSTPRPGFGPYSRGKFKLKYRKSFTRPPSTQYTQAVGGTLNFSGAITKQTNKQVVGTLTTSGTLTTIKAFTKALTGTLTMSGSLVKMTMKQLGGTLTLSGAITKQISKLLVGTLNFSGNLVKQTNKLLAGTLTTSGALATLKAFTHVLSGALTFLGTLGTVYTPGTGLPPGYFWRKIWQKVTKVLWDRNRNDDI